MPFHQHLRGYMPCLRLERNRCQGESCYMGKCECMYAARPDGNGCTLCRTPCGPLAECDEKGKKIISQYRGFGSSLICNTLGPRIRILQHGIEATNKYSLTLIVFWGGQICPGFFIIQNKNTFDRIYHSLTPL